MTSEEFPGLTPEGQEWLKRRILLLRDDLLRDALWLTRNPADADDLVQETLLLLWQYPFQKAAKAGLNHSETGFVLGFSAAINRTLSKEDDCPQLSDNNFTNIHDERELLQRSRRLLRSVYRRMHERRYFFSKPNLSHIDIEKLSSCSVIDDVKMEWERRENALETLNRFRGLLPQHIVSHFQIWVEEEGDRERVAQRLGISTRDFHRELIWLRRWVEERIAGKSRTLCRCSHCYIKTIRRMLWLVAEYLGIDPDVDFDPPCDPFVVLVMRITILALLGIDIADPLLIWRLCPNPIDFFIRYAQNKSLRFYAMVLAAGSSDSKREQGV